MPSPSVGPTSPEGRPKQPDAETIDREYIVSFTERIRVALDDLFDALYPDNDAEVRVDLVRVRADSVEAQFRRFEYSINCDRKPRSGS
jgi:2-methylcitrate dehydratase PrpD